MGSGPGGRIHLCGDIIPSPGQLECHLHELVHLHLKLSCQGGECPPGDGGGAGLPDGGGGARAVLPGAVPCAGSRGTALGPLGLGGGCGEGKEGGAAGASTSGV